MNKIFFAAALATLMMNCTSGQSTTQTASPSVSHFDPEPQNAHPNAKGLLTEDFYWDPVNESAPFGSDDGSDAFQHFYNWRMDNKAVSPVIFLKELIDDWGYEKFDLTITEPAKVKELVGKVGTRMVIGQDNAVIAVGFGQFVLEGKIDKDIQELTRNAITRELTGPLLNAFPENYRHLRKQLLEKMLEAVEKM